MNNYTENSFFDLQQKGAFPSFKEKPVIYGSERFNKLLNAKAILSSYGYTRHKTFFDVVTKSDLCFNIIFDDKGFHLKQFNEV